MEGQVQVVKKASIPPLRTIDKDGAVRVIGDFRDFRWSEELRLFLENASDFSMSWAHLEHGEVLEPHVHPIQSMMVIYQGAGEVIGDLHSPLRAGDVLVVPAGCSHGFVGGPEGMYALTVQLGQGFYTDPTKPRITFVDAEKSLSALLAHNERRLHAFTKRPSFEELAGGKPLEQGACEATLLRLYSWFANTQKVLVARQAGAIGKPHEATLGSQLAELFAQKAGPSVDVGREDTLLTAYKSWFIHQMFLLDELETLVLTDLVLEPANRALEEHIGRSLGSRSRVASAVSRARASSVDEAVLSKATPRTYARLREVSEEGWDMMDAVVDRLAALVFVNSRS